MLSPPPAAWRCWRLRSPDDRQEGVWHLSVSSLPPAWPQEKLHPPHHAPSSETWQPRTFFPALNCLHSKGCIENCQESYSMRTVCWGLKRDGTSLVVQWLKIQLPRQGTRAQSHMAPGNEACGPQSLKPVHLEPVLCAWRSHGDQKPMHRG